MSNQLIQSLNRLRDLKDNWDSYGAPPIDSCAINQALIIALCLPDLPWAAVPTSDGGVQIESHCMGVDIEMRFSRASDEV